MRQIRNRLFLDFSMQKLKRKTGLLKRSDTELLLCENKKRHSSWRLKCRLKKSKHHEPQLKEFSMLDFVIYTVVAAIISAVIAEIIRRYFRKEWSHEHSNSMARLSCYVQFPITFNFPGASWKTPLQNPLSPKEGVYSMLELIIIPIVTGIAVTGLSAIVLRYLDRKSSDNKTRKLKQ